MKSVKCGLILILAISVLSALLLEGCVVMYKVQGLEAKNPQEVKMTGPENKAKID
jgi:outer membrane murein-binding lipoprotein Lpp